MPLALPQGPLVVFVDSAAPTTAADAATLRARRGHLWVSDGPEIWVCVDPANGAAVWKRIANAEDLATIAYSGSWNDLTDTPTTLAGYGITDAALASDLTNHENDTSNPHGVTYTQVGAPPDTRQVIAGTGLTGGGDLTEDRSFALTTAVQASLGLADTAVQPGDLAAIATSGSWSDLSGTPTTLAGYGITDALASANNLADLSDAATARSNLGLGSAAVEDVSAFDAAGSAAAVAGDLLSHEQDTNNPHAVTYAQVGADPVGSAATAESNANSYTDAAIDALGSAAHEHVGTQPLELPRNTNLGPMAFVGRTERLHLYPLVLSASSTVTPDDMGKLVLSEAYNVTLPQGDAPGMGVGWLIAIKNTHSVNSITVDCAGGSDTIDGSVSVSLAAGEWAVFVQSGNTKFVSLV